MRSLNYLVIFIIFFWLGYWLAGCQTYDQHMKQCRAMCSETGASKISYSDIAITCECLDDKPKKKR